MNPTIEPRELYALLDDPRLIILDVSPASNVSRIEPFMPGRCIATAMKFDIKDFTDAASAVPNTLAGSDTFQRSAQSLGINSDSKIVVYDNLGVYSSARVRWMFLAMGHSDVSILNGGLQAWVSAGYATVDQPSAPKQRGNFIASFQGEVYAVSDQLVNNLSNKSHVVIDARSAKRFFGESEEPRPGMRSGHIPSSKNLPFRMVLEDGELKSSPELEAIFTELNPEGKPMTFTCGSGLTACILFTAAQLAGKQDLAVYDGSWSEWSINEAFPISNPTA